jgi:hypothetical protein
VKNRLGTMSNAAVLTNLTNIVHGLAAIRNDLKEIDSLTRSLQDTAEQLEIGKLLLYLVKYQIVHFFRN